MSRLSNLEKKKLLESLPKYLEKPHAKKSTWMMSTSAENELGHFMKDPEKEPDYRETPQRPDGFDGMNDSDADRQKYMQRIKKLRAKGSSKDKDDLLKELKSFRMV